MHKNNSLKKSINHNFFPRIPARKAGLFELCRRESPEAIYLNAERFDCAQALK